MASGVSLAQNFSSTSGGFGGVIKIPGTRSEFSWKSKSFETQPSQRELKVYKSVLQIEGWWIRMKNRKVFRVLKDAICAAEHSLTQEVLRKVSPLEAELLKDPTIKAKVKFRNAGGVSVGGVQYISGRRLIKPASEAAEDSRRQMGNRKFYDQMLVDACHHHQLGVTDEVDVTTMKEYMQYAANVDERPAYMGGKENTWRRLNLDALPRHSFIHNLVEFLEQSQTGPHSHQRTTTSLQRLQSLTRPPTQYEQIEHIKTVSSLRSSPTSRTYRHHPALQESRETLRRSRQAQKRVEQMRRAYGLGGISPLSPEGKGSLKNGRTSELGKEGQGGGDEASFDEMNEIEREADELYQWTQELSFEDIG